MDELLHTIVQGSLQYNTYKIPSSLIQENFTQIHLNNYISKINIFIPTFLPTNLHNLLFSRDYEYLFQLGLNVHLYVRS